MHVRRLHTATSVLATATLIASLVVTPTAGTATAAGGTQVLDSLLAVTSVRYSPNGGDPQVRVTVKRKREIPSLANVRLYWKYSLDERDKRKYDVVNVEGPKGEQTYSLSLHPTVQVARIVIELRLPHNHERKVRYQLVDPRVRYKRFRVSARRAASQALAMHVPAGILTLLPQSRALKFVAGTFLGWTAFSDVRFSMFGSGSGCPPLRRGQFVVQRTWYSHTGATTNLRSRTRIWRSKKRYKRSAPPLCDVIAVVGSYR